DLTHKLEQIDRLLEELQQRRASTLARIEHFRDSLSPHPETESPGHESANDPAVSDRLSGRQ
ncbi:MerR family transcriptional regulator, partial [Halomonas elongata]|nr:MerR family transcriptional regulator [Halomonas elongata]